MTLKSVRHNKVRDPLDDQYDIYPEKVYLCSGDHFLDFEVRVVYCFALLRREFVEAWQVDALGPHLDKDINLGTE